MWVLGQYKDILLDATMFVKQKNIILAGTVVKTVEIGRYNSEDRAIRVLEMIYTHMKNQTGKKAFEMPLG
jgi:hypothetical protein